MYKIINPIITNAIVKIALWIKFIFPTTHNLFMYSIYQIKEKYEYTFKGMI